MKIKNNKYHVKHKRQSLEDFQKDIHRFKFWHNGEKEVSIINNLYICFRYEDNIPDEVKAEIRAKVYELMDKNESKWSVPKGAYEIADAYCAENFC